MDVREAIRERRSVLLFDEQPVSQALLDELIQLSVWAPNHRLTEPWRFHVLDRAALRELFQAVLAEMVEKGVLPPDHDESEHMNQLPPFGVVISQAPPSIAEDPLVEMEDYAACCCVAQNFMLAAHAEGIGTMWLTGPMAMAATAAERLHLEEGSKIVGLIAVGYPREGMRKRSGLRKEPSVTWLTAASATEPAASH
ncbi:MAG: nitroreductase [Dehalococcoidia bacterium]|nr:nitroreductase [Dehalococcoidia bacterium]